LLFLYNAGTRAEEAAQLHVGDLDAVSLSVKILGKGEKERRCPLWPIIVEELGALIGSRSPRERVFLNRRGQPITRFGIHAMVERHVAKAKAGLPSLAAKRISPHTIRHYAGFRTIPGSGNHEERKARQC
jgi:integrase/recombinase XerD